MAMGRPSKYTKERGERICEGLRQGLTRTCAVSAAGIGYPTFMLWLERNVNFFNDVKRAEDEAEAKYAKILLAAAMPHNVVETVETVDAQGKTKTVTTTRREFDWRAAEAWLKRRRKDTWGERIEVKHLTDDQLVRLLNADDPETELTESEFFREDHVVLPAEAKAD